MCCSLALVFCALAAPAGGEGPDIVPGAAGAGVTLGEDRSVVVKREGKPDWSSKHGSLRRDAWRERRPILWYRSGRVAQIGITQAHLKTPEGLSTSSSFHDVVAVHAGLTRRVYTTLNFSGGGALCYYDDRERGIAFEFAQNLDPDSARRVPFRLYAIHVHLPGKAVLPDFDEVPAPPALSAKCPDEGEI